MSTMYIRNIQFSQTTKHAVLWTEVKNAVTDEVLYFAVERKYAVFVAKDVAPFVASVFLTMAKAGQALSVETPVSKWLLNDLRIANRILKRQNSAFKTVRVSAETTTDKFKGKRVACLYSGDLVSTDSFLHKNRQKRHITHLIFVHGLNGREDDNGLLAQLKKLATSHKISLVEVQTNIRDFTDPIALWSFSSIGVLSAAGIFLRNGFKKVLVPTTGKKVLSVLDKDWISKTVRDTHIQHAVARNLFWKIRELIRDFDARYNSYRLYKFLARSGLIKRKKSLVHA